MRDEKKKESSFIPPPSALIPKIRRALRGEVDARTVILETLRRGRVSLRRRRERASFSQSNAQTSAAPARLCAAYARLSPTELLEHFRRRATPRFLPGLDASK